MRATIAPVAGSIESIKAWRVLDDVPSAWGEIAISFWILTDLRGVRGSS
jgi:hypothetical protein